MPPMILHSAIKDGNIHPNLMCPSSGSEIKTYFNQFQSISIKLTGIISDYLINKLIVFLINTYEIEGSNQEYQTN